MVAGRDPADLVGWFYEMTGELFARLPLGYFFLDPDGRLTYANPVALTLAGGMALATARGQMLRELFPSIVDARFEDAVTRTAAGETIEYEQFFPPTGRWLHVIACPTPLGRGVFIRDITDAREVQRQAQDLERLIHGSLDAMMDPFAISHPTLGEDGRLEDFRLEYLNRAARDFAGVGPEEAAGKGGLELFPGLRSNGLGDALGRVLETGEPLLVTAIAGEDTLPNGKQVSGFFDVQAVRFEDRLLTIWRDVTNREQTARAMKLTSEVRTVLVEALTTIPTSASLQDAARQICERLVTLPAVDAVWVDVFVGESVEIMGAAARPTTSKRLTADDRLEPERVNYLRARSPDGSWAESWAPGAPLNGRTGPGREGLLAAAYGPILHDGETVGLLCLATGDEAFANALVESMPDMITLTAGSGAILAERLHHFRQDVHLRNHVGLVLAERSFEPVFQAIVELDGREVVGYEALTRFPKRLRPDEAFRRAWSVGMGPQLELATLATAIEAADALPAGRWLSVNVSPSLVTESTEILAGTLRTATRPIVLEITENGTIADYAAFQIARQMLGADVRMAVDDAGAGVANFGHIVEIRPDLVKLDASLIHGVHRSLERQALVRAMVLFARTAGCSLVAEGVETEQEARALVELGVEFGQGYLFGRPQRVRADTEWVRRGPAPAVRARRLAP